MCICIGTDIELCIYVRQEISNICSSIATTEWTIGIYTHTHLGQIWLCRRFQNALCSWVCSVFSNGSILRTTEY
jgi:hypothetical protein